MNEALKVEWAETRGLSVGKITLNPITLSDADMKAISEMEDAATMGSNPFMMAGRMTNATANAMEIAAGNENGAMMGFMDMNMAGGAMGGGFNAAQNFYNMGVANQSQSQSGAKEQGTWKCSCGTAAKGNFCPECGAAKPCDNGWKCSCGEINKGKFCSNCGTKKPADALLYRCDKCGWEPEDPKNPPKFCPECGDRFDDNDTV
jgi:membrane protease subunit (stomatin/prohibitin family)